MPRRYITTSEQQAIIDRAKRKCEYCQCPMDYSPQPFACEHITPVSKSGETSLNNLALACGGCNGFKYTKQEAIDPNTSENVPLHHPRREIWLEHFS